MKFSQIALTALCSLAFAMSASAQDAPSAGRWKPPPPAPDRVTDDPNRDSPRFGLNDQHFVKIGGSEFSPDNSATQYSSSWYPEGGASFNYRRYITTGYPHLIAWAHVPGGAVLDLVELDYCNSDATHDLVLNVYHCDYVGTCDSAPIATLTAAANSGCSYARDDTLTATVNNNSSEYLLDAVWPDAPPGPTMGIAGAMVAWKYQVSPAPGVATFNDVPTSDPAFQYIEALVASGVTAGCGGGNYCPDAALTRRQMAVFLSKALGLYWNGY